MESFLKRCANVKDSGSMLSEHGGILDRIDSIILVFPYLYWYSLEYLDYTHSPNYDFAKINPFSKF
jgi:CDP-diglyceride synthetase